MNIIGQAIDHKKFGSGVVMAVSDGVVTVRFRELEKKFIYPDAFKKYLILQDKNKLEYMTDQLAKREAELNRQRQAEKKEQERIRKLHNFTITANSHAVFNVAPERTQEVCKTCSVSTGRYLSGYSKGQCRIAERLKPNSVCLLTERPCGKPEQEREIIGAFMVKEDFFGEDVHDGMVKGHPKYRIMLPAGTSMLFWEYFTKDVAPRWGNTAFKYCSVAVMNQILSKMLQKLANTAQSKLGLAFYKNFCKINQVKPLAGTNLELEPEGTQ